VDFSGRSLPAADLLGIVALELLVHAWDLATATGDHAGALDRLIAFTGRDLR
jgi:hypothetical protein